MAHGFKGESVPIPDVISPIEGWRFWIPPSDAILDEILPWAMADNVHAVTGYPWKPGPNRAGCIGYPIHTTVDPYSVPFFAYKVCEEIPSPEKGQHGGHGCGFYVYKTLADCLLEINNQGWGTKQLFLLGKTLVWGKVYEHESGYRAEYAEVSQFCYGLNVGPSVDELARMVEKYRVPVKNFAEVLISDESLTTKQKTAYAMQHLNVNFLRYFLHRMNAEGLITEDEIGPTPEPDWNTIIGVATRLEIVRALSSDDGGK